MKPQDFLSKEEQEMIVSAIREAEMNTSGEIRVHIDDTCEGDAYRKAVEVFYRLGMEKTRSRMRARKNEGVETASSDVTMMTLSAILS